MGREDALDLTQTTFRKIFEKLSDYQPAKGNFRSWAFRISRNLFIDSIRAKRETAVADIEAFIIPLQGTLSHEEKDQLEAVNRQIVHLPGQMKTLIQMKYLWNFRNVDIARELGIEERSVSSQISRAIEKLSRLVSDSEKRGIP